MPTSPVWLDGSELPGTEVRREWKHIDLLLACKQPPFVVAIENKIDAGSGNPFKRYEDAVRSGYPGVPYLLVYLTLGGDALSEYEEWVPWSYADLHRVLTRVRNTNETSIGDDVLAFLDHYLRLIGSRFMDDPQIDKLCREIYKNHRQAIDLIVERTGQQTEALDALESAIAQDERFIQEPITRGFAVIPASWLEVMPPIGQWEGAEQRWLRCNIQLRKAQDGIQSEMYACPTTNPPLRREIVLRLIADHDEFGLSTFFKNLDKLGDIWTKLSKDRVMKWEPGETPESEAIEKQVKRHLDSLYTKLAGVPDAIRPIVEQSKRRPTP